MAKNQIEKTIESNRKRIQKQIDKLQEELKHWDKIASDYETNRVTIESILSIQSAPDLGKSKTTRGRKVAAK